MISQIILLLTIIAYSIIVSQSLMYILALKYTQLKLDARPYIEVRQLIDTAMNKTFRYVIYAALFFNLLLVIMMIQQPSSLLFTMASIAMIALIADVLFTVKGNLPINATINTWTIENYPDNWQEYRKNWLRYFSYRQIANITGFTCLLIGAVFQPV